jgi:polar amino acid transport system substrate-binding protein
VESRSLLRPVRAPQPYRLLEYLEERHLEWSLRLLVAVALWVSAFTVGHADQLDNIRAGNVLRVAVSDGNPPFSFVDPLSRTIIGYDIDFARAIATGIGVELQLVVAALTDRVALLQSRKVDLVVAEMTITPERAERVAFSIPYFEVGQQLVVLASSSDRIEDYGSSRIGAARGSTEVEYLANDFPAAKVSLFNDGSQALQALRVGTVDALIGDSPTLASLIVLAPDRERFKMIPDQLWQEDIGIGMARNEPALLAAVNSTLLTLESTGEAERIYHVWFDRFGQASQVRPFKIKVPCEAVSGWTIGDCTTSPLTR